MDIDAFYINIAEESTTNVSIENLEINMGDQGAVVTVDLSEGDLITVTGVGSLYHVEDDASEGEATFYSGSITLAGDDDHVVDLGATVLDAAELFTAGNENTWGSWTITTADGADTITGNSGADTISTGAGNDTIDGAAGNDVITAGNGADEITVGTGKDTVDLSETVSATDVVIFAAADDGGEAGETGGTFAGFDVITGFDTTVDDIQYDGSGVDTGAEAELIIAGTVGDNDITASNYTDVDDVLAFINDAEVVALADAVGTGNDDGEYDANEDFLIAVTIGSSLTALYEFTSAAGGDAGDLEVALVATVDAKLVAADFI
jgi:Ca2+-binding RTX toxin-like protein